MPKILVVEDEEIVRTNIAEILESEGFQVESAENGISAIQKIDLFFPDVIVSDVMMPGMDGYELVKYIQQNPLTSSIPIILLTARADTQDVRRGMQYGADDYITKPFRAQDLINAVTTRLAKQKNYDRKFHELKSNISMYIPHELRTPLVSILGFADLIINNLDDLEKDEIRQMAGKVKNSGLRLYERIEKFLYFSELELIKTDPRLPEDCVIDQTLVESLLSSKFKEKNIECVEVNIENEKLCLSQDYLSRILIELVDNAYKFIEKDPKIIVNGKTNFSEYILTVEDNGIGMSEIDIKQISVFKQFNREEFQQEGNGLGLAIVKSILDLVGGYFEVESRPGVKTKFIIHIPVVKE
ncbi:MAG TPA: hybrid sensor histidine kinase/response regulator [Ignavibacteria bacterium]|nr:hybrid sensor histidine kinase/response regulator [Ignavibacteria bacterium]